MGVHAMAQNVGIGLGGMAGTQAGLVVFMGAMVVFIGAPVVGGDVVVIDVFTKVVVLVGAIVGVSHVPVTLNPPAIKGQ